MSTDPVFAKYLSKSQITNLNLAGIHSLYSLLIFLPSSLENLEPFENFATSFGEEQVTKTKYLLQSKLTALIRNTGKTGQPYFYLSFQKNNQVVNCYYFASSPYAAKSLTIGSEFQLIMTNSNGLWSIEKITEYKGYTEPTFKLGQAEITKHLLPKYPKTGFLQSPFFAQVYLQIPRPFFKLNLAGLVPENPIIPSEIDFWNIHHPSSVTKYHQTMQQWIGLKVFLKLSLMKYIDANKEKKFAKASNIDIDFLKNLSSNLPFDLSNSQKTAIWSILDEVNIKE
jgi:RecG-like helicase